MPNCCCGVGMPLPPGAGLNPIVTATACGCYLWKSMLCAYCTSKLQSHSSLLAGHAAEHNVQLVAGCTPVVCSICASTLAVVMLDICKLNVVSSG
eukprot:18422-Heterococcus_DN1.PRE.2